METEIRYEIVRETWLTRKPSPNAASVALLSTGALMLGALIYLFGPESWSTLMNASGQTVFEAHQYWRLWTTLFAHGDVGHLAANTLLFFILGYFLNGYFGNRLFPLGAFFWGGVINWIALKTYEPEMILLGASGVIYWMGGVWLVLYATLSLQKNRLQRYVRTLGVAFLIFMPAESFQANVSYRTHGFGFAIGVVIGIWHYLRHRRRFQKAEVRELVIEPADPEPLPETLRGSGPDFSDSN